MGGGGGGGGGGGVEGDRWKPCEVRSAKLLSVAMPTSSTPRTVNNLFSNAPLPNRKHRTRGPITNSIIGETVPSDVTSIIRQPFQLVYWITITSNQGNLSISHFSLSNHLTNPQVNLKYSSFFPVSRTFSISILLSVILMTAWKTKLFPNLGEFRHGK